VVAAGDFCCCVLRLVAFDDVVRKTSVQNQYLRTYGSTFFVRKTSVQNQYYY